MIPSASHLEPGVNLDLARRVYEQDEGTIDLVPGPDTICCVVIDRRSGERVVGSTSTALAACGAHGFIRSGTGRSATFFGVLSARAWDLRIVSGAGEAIAVPLNADHAYWITVTDPVEIVFTRAGGTAQRIPVVRPGMG